MSALVDHRTYLSDVLARQVERRRLADPGHEYAAQPALAYASSQPTAGPSNTSKGKTKANVVNYIGAEEAVRNDYAAWYGVSGEYPTNHVLGAGDDEICDEFPALRRLMDLKAEHVNSVSHPALFAQLPSPSPSIIQSTLSPHRFDAVLIHRQASWAETAALPIRQLSADPGFVFLWVGRGDSDGLERGRECLAKWGFRRAEDIVWVKTNKGGGDAGPADGKGLFASQKEHCLMGIRGTVRRSTDSRFLHCNVDTDVIVWEGDEDAPRTPPYLYTLIENFCLGARRLELFGDGNRARRGWVTAAVGPTPDGTATFDAQSYPHLLPSKDEGKPVVPFHAEIDALRPKSPQRRVRGAPGGGGGGGARHHNPHNQQHHSPSPQPSFRPSSAGVMRMGALTPAYPQQQAMAQQMPVGVPIGMVPPQMMGQMMMGQMGMGQMQVPMQMGMGMPMPHHAMGGLGVMGMGGMAWPGAGMMMGGMGMPGMVPGMGMGMMVPGGMMGGGLSPQHQHGGLSPSPDEGDWSVHQHHQHHMGQLALGMGNMGVGGAWAQQQQGQQGQNEHGQWQ